MIREFAQLENTINERAQVVGRAIQAAKHYDYMEAAPFPAAIPCIASYCHDSVDIIVGLSQDGRPVTVRVPVQLFETGNLAAIKLWVTQVNNAHDAACAKNQDQRDAEARHRDMQVIKELKDKYPDEFR